ncbi:lycopene beta-cyclase CrtY [Erythrobacter sp.]|uniref:lycopene beta-cyclase CrtY n=1 Tax=Erythrobacter sp. TaxID=1042 RepID=UPI001B01D1FD|nr:lycopene beta-cyclase CrtY [Erythrobacter sp.]MBO6525563.1 lycopene beta-cyclase CrtY [Erythrobacter sp.]MBO6529764.1 lycopene beta-cyclase CrtY [Erythrobacter sp.]
MSGRTIDMAIVGGGLAGGLAALAVHRAHPDLSIALFEAGESYGGNHRWSWFTCDVDEAGADLLAAFPKAEWAPGYDVLFPGYTRTLSAAYRSLASADFDATLRRALPQAAIRTGSRVADLRPDCVVLDSGERITAKVVVDCRDFRASLHLRGGWQVFMGRHLRTSTPHDVARPIVMDARVTQHDGYRFVYTLPLAADELFVEDTYYADSPVLDRAVLAGRIDRYCDDMGWSGETIGGETGVLPVITGGDFAAFRRELGAPGVVRAGARGGFVHPLTSYTLPFAVANALILAREAQLPGERLAELFERRAHRHWRKTRFYRALGRMLFDAAKPDKRYRVFQRFYRLREPLVERFYAGRPTRADKLRILTGKPPVAIPSAIRALLGKGSPLVHERSP